MDEILRWSPSHTRSNSGRFARCTSHFDTISPSFVFPSRMLGEVYAMGRCHEGQLGIDQLSTHLSQPTLIPTLSNIVDIACGNHVSFATDRQGKVFSFGAGTSLQHGHGQEDVRVPRLMSSKFMDIKTVVSIAIGAQHTLFLTHDNPAKGES